MIDKVKIVRFYTNWERTVEYTDNSDYSHIIKEFINNKIDGFIIWKNDVKFDTSANYENELNEIESRELIAA